MTKGLPLIRGPGGWESSPLVSIYRTLYFPSYQTGSGGLCKLRDGARREQRSLFPTIEETQEGTARAQYNRH